MQQIVVVEGKEKGEEKKVRTWLHFESRLVAAYNNIMSFSFFLN
jgi:hypothetical protein